MDIKIIKWLFLLKHCTLCYRWWHYYGNKLPRDVSQSCQKILKWLQISWKCTFAFTFVQKHLRKKHLKSVNLLKTGISDYPISKRNKRFCLKISEKNQVIFFSIFLVCDPISIAPPLYFVSSRERQWRHWACPRIHASRRILYASIPVFLFERVKKTTSCARDDKRLCLEYALTPRSFSGWDKV